MILKSKKLSKLSKRLGLNDFYELYSLKEQTKLFDDLEKGFISDQEFCKHIKDKFTLPATMEEIIHAWNALLIGFNEEALPAIELAKTKFKIGLLSNTNSMHMEQINMESKALFGVQSFYELFDGYFLSFQMETRKPEHAIYKAVEQQLGCDGVEIYFIDDNEKNVEAAFENGWYVHLKKKEESILEVVQKIVAGN